MLMTEQEFDTAFAEDMGIDLEEQAFMAGVKEDVANSQQLPQAGEREADDR